MELTGIVSPSRDEVVYRGVILGSTITMKKMCFWRMIYGSYLESDLLGLLYTLFFCFVGLAIFGRIMFVIDRKQFLRGAKKNIETSEIRLML